VTARIWFGLHVTGSKDAPRTAESGSGRWFRTLFAPVKKDALIPALLESLDRGMVVDAIDMNDGAQSS
jgi:hypothetical protein